MLALVEFDFAGSGVLTARVLAFGEAEVRGSVSASPAQLGSLAATSWGLDDDLAECWTTLGKDPNIAPLAARYRGIRLARVPDLYEALLVAILGQQISVQAATACRLRLMASLGEHLEVAGTTYTTYPLPRSLLAAGEEELRALGTGRQKARYLHALAKAATEGKLGQAVFDDLSDEAAIAALCEISGVGRWTAEVALLRGLGRLDAFPAGDLGLQVAAQRALRLEARPSERQLRAMAERWHPWRGYAALYLWGYLRDST